VIIYGLLGLLVIILVVWLRTQVADHLAITLSSDVAEVEITKPVVFSGLLVDSAGTPQVGKVGTLDGLGPDETATASIPITTDEAGKFTASWAAILPTGEWAFIATVETVASNKVTVTLSTAIVG
jgi:hypothetical protein